MKLKLHHVPNPDIPGGYYEPPIDPQEMTITVDVISDASQAYRQWIERNGLGGGNMSIVSGLLYLDKSKYPYAKVSYNGNVFTIGGEKLYDTKTHLAEINCLPAMGQPMNEENS